jgi:hypothetical protein
MGRQRWPGDEMKNSIVVSSESLSYELMPQTFYQFIGLFTDQWCGLKANLGIFDINRHQLSAFLIAIKAKPYQQGAIRYLALMGKGKIPR